MGSYTKWEYQREQGDAAEIARLRGVNAALIAKQNGVPVGNITITAHPPINAPGQVIPNPRDRLVQVDYTWP